MDRKNEDFRDGEYDDEMNFDGLQPKRQSEKPKPVKEPYVPFGSRSKRYLDN